MKCNCIIPKCQIIDIEKKNNKDNSISWFEVDFIVGYDRNRVTCSKEFAESVKAGEQVNIVLELTEQAKNNFIVTKFKATGTTK